MPAPHHHITALSQPAVGVRQQLSFAPHLQVGSVEASLSAGAASHPSTKKISLFPIYSTPHARLEKFHSPAGRNGTVLWDPGSQNPSALLPTQTSVKTCPHVSLTLPSPWHHLVDLLPSNQIFWHKPRSTDTGRDSHRHDSEDFSLS